MKLSFKTRGKMIELKGIVKKYILRMISAAKIYKNLKETLYGFMGKLFSIKATSMKDKKELKPKFKELLDEFRSILKKLKDLLSVRNLDHMISLLPRVEPVNMRLHKSYFMHKKKLKGWLKRYYSVESYNTIAALLFL
jgi:ethanolamine utilization cobalamin adenosyltransferase